MHYIFFELIGVVEYIMRDLGFALMCGTHVLNSFVIWIYVCVLIGGLVVMFGREAGGGIG